MYSSRLVVFSSILIYSEFSNACDGTVTAIQTLIGSEKICVSTDHSRSADVLFAVYSDTTHGIPTCKKFRDKDAC